MKRSKLTAGLMLIIFGFTRYGRRLMLWLERPIWLARRLQRFVRGGQMSASRCSPISVGFIDESSLDRYRDGLQKATLPV